MLHWGQIRGSLLALTTLWSLPIGVALADTFQVTKVADSRDGTCNGDCSLREAIIASNAHPGPDIVVVPPGVYVLQQAGQGEDQALAGDLDILDDLSITGAGSESTRIDGNRIDRVFEIFGPVVVGLNGLTVQSVGPFGPFINRGTIVNRGGTLTLTNCTQSDDSGYGGIYNYGGTVTMENCTLSNSSNNGTMTLTNCTLGLSGITNSSGTVTAIESTLRFIDNSDTMILTNCTLGNVVSNNRSTGIATLTGCTLSGFSSGLSNSGMATLTDCTLSGASVENSGGTLTMENCTQSGDFGVGITNKFGGTVTMENCTLSGNIGSSYGGAVANDSGTVTMENCTLSGNSALQGGAIANIRGGTVILTNSTLSDNSATGDGGGFYNEGMATLTNCTFSSNSSGGAFASGGGLSNYGIATLTDCTLSDNSATGNGGAIYNRASGLLCRVCSGDGDDVVCMVCGSTTLTNCTLSGNSALQGGAINNYDTVENIGTVTMENCTLSGNVAHRGGRGGGINNSDTIILTNCTLSGNSGQSAATIYSNTATPIAIAAVTLLSNTIIANSHQSPACAVPVRSNGHNLDDDGSCGFFNTGDLSLVAANLAPLGDYGGLTQTHSLCTGPGVPDPDCTATSPAIDAGDNVQCPATDQRGAPRPHGSTCDIGAFESGAPGPPPHTATPTATPQPTSTPGPCYGDCNGDQVVRINELILGVNIALDTATLDQCPAFDCNGNGRVGVDCLVKAVNAVLNGCRAS